MLYVFETPCASAILHVSMLILCVSFRFCALAMRISFVILCVSDQQY
jgi:hypothetical protein